MGYYVTENQVQAEQIKLKFTFVWAFQLKVCYQNHAYILFWILCYREKCRLASCHLCPLPYFYFCFSVVRLESRVLFAYDVFCGYCWSEGTYAYTALLPYQEAVKGKPFLLLLLFWRTLFHHLFPWDLWGSCKTPIYIAACQRAAGIFSNYWEIVSLPLTTVGTSS